MIVRRLAAVGLMVLSLAAVCCSVVSAVPLFTDNFDSYTSGNLQGQGGWTGGGSAVRVQSAFVKSGKSVQMDYLSWGAQDVTHNVTTDTTYYLSVDVAMDTASPNVGENLGYIKLLNINGAEITRIYLAQRQIKILLGPGSASVIQDNAATRAWYNIRIAVYPSNNTMDVWVDGVKKVTGGSTYSVPSALSRVVMGEWSSLGTKFTKSEIYVDNLSVDPPAENAQKIISPYGYTNWEATNVMYPFVMYDTAASNYKMWYAGSAFAQANDSNWDQWAIGIATSADGVTWARRKYDYEPVLYAHKFLEGDVVDPATFSNIFDSIFAFGPCVIRDGSTYKMWYTGWNGNSEHIGGGITRKINYRIGYATSPDGINWTKYSGSAGAGSILGLGASGAMDAKGAGQPYVLKEGSNYRMWYEGMDANGVCRILYATSSDGINWTKQSTALIPGGNGTLDEKGARNPVVVMRNSQYEMWYTGESAASHYSHIMRATSADGLTWTKVPGEVDLHPDDPLDGNERMHVDSVIVNPDNSCRVFFGKDIMTPATYSHGTIMAKSTHIYTEVVNP